MSCKDFKGLTRRTASNKMMRDKAFNRAENLKYVGNQMGLALMVYKFFDKKLALFAGTSVSSCEVKIENMSNQELAEKLHKQIIRIFEK